MKRLTQGLAVVVCVTGLGFFSSATAKDAKANTDDVVAMNATVNLDQSSAISTMQEVKNCGRCGSISNSDARNFCYARCEGKSGYCGAIRDSDKRNYCYAVVDGKPGYCGAIRKQDLRNQCYAEAG